MSSRRIIKVVDAIRRLEEMRDDVIQHMGEEGWNGSDAERQLEEAYDEYHFLISPTERKGGAKLSERGLAGYLREKFYFGALGSPAYPLYEFLSAVVHSPNTKPMPSHPFSSLLVGNEASVEKALEAIIKARGWQRYVSPNTRWGEATEGFSVVPTVAPSASASAPAPAPPPPAVNPWSSGSKRGTVVLGDPGGGGGAGNPEDYAGTASTGLSMPMAGVGFEEEEDEGEPAGQAVAEAVASGASATEALAPTAEAVEPPRAKPKKPKKAKEEEVDLEAEAEATKLALFKQVEEAYEKKVDGVSPKELEDIVAKENAEMDRLRDRASALIKQIKTLRGLKKTLEAEYDKLTEALKEGDKEGRRMTDEYVAYLDRIEPLKKTNTPEYVRLKDAKEGDKIKLEELKAKLSQLLSEAETQRERYTDVLKREQALVKEYDGIEPLGQASSARGEKADKALRKNPIFKLLEVLRERGLVEEFNRWLKRPKEAGKGRYRGSGARPSNNILQKIAVQSYNPNPERVVGDFTLFRATPTLKFYKQGDTVVVGVRGTVPTDIEDVKADGLIALNKLEGSPRFQRDVAELRKVKKSMPNLDFYGVGHSLGGAVLDGLLRENLLISGVSYNPAVQPKDFNSNLPNSRIYQKGDPLYALGKNFLKNAPEVRGKPTSWKDRLISLVPFAGSVYDYLDAHNLSNFEGGGKSAKRPTPLNPLSREEYLSRVRAKAKSEGYPYKLLGYADDGKHKFQIPNADGKIIRFGRAGYGDFHIWSALEASGKVAKGYADGKRRAFRNSHNKIKGRWRSDLFSPNNLALKILW